MAIDQKDKKKSMKDVSQPIMITGLPRSGTTWLCNAVSTTIHGRLVHEPFNWKRFPDRLPYHMKYMPADAEDTELLHIFKRSIWQTRLFSIWPWSSRRTVIKDVHVCLALEYIFATLNPRIIIIMRHPCAMANSWQALNLEAGSRLELLLSQKELVDKFLKPFEAHMISSDDYFFQIGAYWGASYYIMKELSAKHPEWQWITHEQLCIDPVAHYKNLFSRIGLPLTEKENQRLEQFLSQHNRPGTHEEGVLHINRVTNKEPEKWQRELSPEQIQTTLAGAAPFELLQTFDDAL